MIRMFQSQTSAQAKSYFRDALSKADYYIEDQEMNGHYNGKIAKRLGLEGKIVDRKSFEQLCDNIHPQTGANLTPRTVKDRRVGYDISFHCPKSVSILHVLDKRDHALTFFKEAVEETMVELEADMQARIRKEGQSSDRDTGELLWADFVHQTARPVEGHAPDPHLHCHCFSFNVTFDEKENTYKAGQFFNLKRDMPYYQSRFQKRLADKFAQQGYGIRRTANGFELSVVPQQAIDHFSKRTNLIGQIAKEKSITDPKTLDQLGAKTRSAKIKNLSMPKLRKIWRDQLITAGIGKGTTQEPTTTNLNMTSQQTIDHAISHVYERASVKRERQILGSAYHYAIDRHDITLDSIEKSFAEDGRIFKIKEGNQYLCTTAIVHDEEKNMIRLAMGGRGKCHPICSSIDYESITHLNPEQQRVTKHILSSSDRLMMMRGGAGTGKTTLLKTVVPLIEQTGKKVHLLAPTSEASRDVLFNEGFKDADTIARFMVDKEKQQQVKNQVIWVDEAGMLGAKDMHKLLDIAKNQNARLILSGDPKQHTAVLRGDAMRLLQKIGRIPYVSMNTIYRQKTDQYKQAVKAISEGDIKTGFKQLDAQNAIREVKPEDVSTHLVKDYLKVIDDKKTALVVSPTNQQKEQVTKDIRKGLQQKGYIGKRERVYTTYKNLYYTDAQKQDSRLYSKGQIVQAHQHMPGLKRGSANSIDHVNQSGVWFDTSTSLPLNRHKDFDVYIKKQTPLSKGDTIRITKNGTSFNGDRLNNGTILNVTSFTSEGHICAEKRSQYKTNPVILDKTHGNFDYAYCMTSYSSQGKTVDHVLIAQPCATFPASDQKQFYVSVSRGRESVCIYTDDKEELLSAIQSSGDRQGATEIVSNDMTTRPFNKSSDLDIMPPIIAPDSQLPTTEMDFDNEPEL